MKNKVGILGSGAVGKTLANGFLDLGWDVTIANRSAHKVEGWNGPVSTFSEAAKNSNLLILCVKGSVAEELIENIKANLTGKTVIDTTNPIGDKPPVNGVLNFFTDLNESLMEKLQKIAPNVHFVKAFNSVGNAQMVRPNYKEGKPTMFICGNNKDSKREVSKLLDALGWEVADMGAVEAARAIEPLCMLWCIPGFLNNSWNHAFKLLKP